MADIPNSPDKNDIVLPKGVPTPSSELTQAQLEIWVSVFKNIQPDWIGVAQYPIVEQLVRHIDMSREIAALIDQHRSTIPDDFDTWVGTLDRLGKMLQRETGAINSAATKLRITNSAILINTPGKSPHGKGPADSPWEFDGADEEDAA